MDDQVLSQDERNSLLGETGAGAVPPSENEFPARGWQERQLDGVQVRYQGVCQDLAMELQEILGTPVDLEVADLRMTSVGEFILGMEPPTCLNVIRAEPLESRWFLEMEPAVLFPMIGRLLGGSIQDTYPIYRAATEIELHLIRQVVERCLVVLQRAWAGTLDCSFVLDQVESNPQRITGLVPRDALVLVRLNLCFDGIEGSWCHGLPANALHSARAPLAAGLLAKSSLPGPAQNSDPETFQELRALLAQLRIAPEDFALLSEGDVLRTPIDADQDLQVYLGHQARFTARPGTLEGYKAIEIRQVLDPPPQDRSE